MFVENILLIYKNINNVNYNLCIMCNYQHIDNIDCVCTFANICVLHKVMLCLLCCRCAFNLCIVFITQCMINSLCLIAAYKLYNLICCKRFIQRTSSLVTYFLNILFEVFF